MRFSDLSTEQQAAIRAPGPLLLRAGAGTGKTEVLAHRFVALVAGDLEGRAPLSPDRIAAITFTEKATADMRSRIASVLDERLAEESSVELARHLDAPRRTLALAPISTIHGFCLKLLRENPLACGLDAGFAVLAEHEEEFLFGQVVTDSLADAVRSDLPGARDLVAARSLDRAAQEMQALVDELGHLGQAAEWVRERLAETRRTIAASQRELSLAASELAERIDALLNAGRQAAPNKIEPLAAQWDHYRELIQKLSHFAADFKLIAELRRLCDLMPDARSPLKAEVLAVRELLERTNNALGLKGNLVEAMGLMAAEQTIPPAAELLIQILDALDLAKTTRRAATFGDILNRARQLLVSQPDVLSRYRSSLRAVLVDEYQDTDAVQDAIVRTLCESPGRSDPPELFIVGDEKQSIYRFRGATVALFNAAARRLSVRALRENLRAVPNLVCFANGLGAALMGTAPAEHVAATDHAREVDFHVCWNDEYRLCAKRTGAEEPSLELFVMAQEDDRKRRAGDRRVIEARALARHIMKILAQGRTVVDRSSKAPRPARYGDVAFLLRAFTDVELYERALREAGVPYYTVSGRGFFSRREIIDAASLLAALDDPSDELSLAAALRSPFFGLSDRCLLEIALRVRGGDEQAPAGSLGALVYGPEPSFDWLTDERPEAERAFRIMRELRALYGRIPLAKLLSRLYELTDIEAVMLGLRDGKQRVANLRKFREVALEFDSGHLSDLGHFIDHVRRLTEQPPREGQAQIATEDDDVVRLMTIHAAKGLEFPIVVIPDLGRGSGNDSPRFALSPKHGVLACAAIGAGYAELPNRLMSEYRQRVAQEEKEEAARLLYVAVTRARDLLILSDAGNTRNWAAQIRDFIGADTVAKFASSNQPAATATVAGVTLTLRRCATEPPPPAQPIVIADDDAQRARFRELAAKRLSFEPPEQTELLVTATELAGFAQCPRRYLLRDMLGVPENGEWLGTGDAALALGTVAHSVLERAGDNLAAEDIPAFVNELVGRLCTGTAIGTAEQSELSRDLVRYLAAPRPAGEQILERELPFFLRVAAGDCTLFVRGKIDALVRSPTAALLVRDYKYSRPSAGNLAAYRRQMEPYMLAVAQAYGEKQVAAELVFLRGKTETVRLPSLSAGEIESRLAQAASEIRTARRLEQFDKRPSQAAQCREFGCGYTGVCWGRVSNFEHNNAPR